LTNFSVESFHAIIVHIVVDVNVAGMSGHKVFWDILPIGLSNRYLEVVSSISDYFIRHTAETLPSGTGGLALCPRN
jgi:hypothetical protein